MNEGRPDIEAILQDERARSQPTRLPLLSAVEHTFTKTGESRYRLALPDLQISLDVDRLRRERNELIGEVTACCGIPGAHTVDGKTLDTSDLNFSRSQARQWYARFLASRANTGKLEWLDIVQEFSMRVANAERDGDQGHDLRTCKPVSEEETTIGWEGFFLPHHHPSILFGDGGSLKSYFALYVAGKLSEQGLNVGVFDWELSGEDHWKRFNRLFLDGMPHVHYVNCTRPLQDERDRIHKIVEDQKIDYAIYDSIAFACTGPPEDADSARIYFQCVRFIGCGSLHIAHVNKTQGGDQKPFGSAFWHNGARSTWFAKAPESSGSDEITVGLFNRKSNLGKLANALSFRFTFEKERVTIRRADVCATPELFKIMSVRQRMLSQLRSGQMTRAALAEACEAEEDTVKRTANRSKDIFLVLPNGDIGLRYSPDKNGSDISGQENGGLLDDQE